MLHFLPLIRQFREAKRIQSLTHQQWLAADLQHLAQSLHFTFWQREGLLVLLGWVCTAGVAVAAVAGFALAQLLGAQLPFPASSSGFTTQEYILIGAFILIFGAVASASAHDGILAPINKVQGWLQVAEEYRCADAVRLLQHPEVLAFRDQVVGQARQITRGDLERMRLLADEALTAASKNRSEEVAALAKEEARRLCRVMHGLESA